MSSFYDAPFDDTHEHVFLGAGHERNERKTWVVIVLCGAMMIAEIAGGSITGSLALVADGLHMSTHAGAMLIAAIAYTYARRHSKDRRFVFGTGKLGDLAGFTSAIILAMIALLIGYEAVVRFISPVPIQFGEAIPIAVVGLVVNLVSAWLLSGDEHHHDHGHHGHGHSGEDEVRRIETSLGAITLSILEEGRPPVFELRGGPDLAPLSLDDVNVTTIRADGARQLFNFVRQNDRLLSALEIPEPHTFKVALQVGGGEYVVEFAEAEDGHVDGRDHNMRAAYIHVIADSAVSVLAIVGLLLAKSFGWLWMDPLAGVIGGLVIANWSYGLIRDTGAILVDITPDEALTVKVKAALESSGDKLVDLHLWRLGPGHLSLAACLLSSEPERDSHFYHSVLKRFKALSHVTVEVRAPRVKSARAGFGRVEPKADEP